MNKYKDLSKNDVIGIVEDYENTIYQLVAYTKDKRYQGKQLENKLRKLIKDLSDKSGISVPQTSLD